MGAGRAGWCLIATDGGVPGAGGPVVRAASSKSTHVDGDRSHYDPSRLVVLCKKCHLSPTTARR